MGTSELVSGINKLQKEKEKKLQLTIAAELLYNDYMNDPELTALTVLDQEDFVLSMEIK
jgi:hypothetical protein